jgi:hypothetical protein
MKVNDGGAQFIENVAARFDHQNRLRRVLELTLPVIETLSAGKNSGARGKPVLDQMPGNVRRLFLGIACGEYDDLVSHHTRISPGVGHSRPERSRGSGGGNHAKHPNAGGSTNDVRQP